MKRLIVILLAILLLFSLFSGALRENVVTADNQPVWPMYGYNAQRTGRCPYDTSWNTGKLKYQLQQRVSVIGSDGTMYGGSGYYFYAMSTDGTLKWQYRVGGEIRNSPAVAPDGTVYFGCDDYFIYAIKPDGTLKWKFATRGYPDFSPAVAPDGTVYIGSDDDYFYAINPDGTLKWRYWTRGYNSSPAIASDGTIYVGSPPFIYSLDANGSLKWKYEVNSDPYASPVVGPDGTVYIGSNNHCLYSLSSSGTLNWKFETGNWIWSSPAIASDGTIYVGSEDGYFYALYPNGTLKWKFDCDTILHGSHPVISSEGTVYFTGGTYLYALNPDGTLKWKTYSGGYPIIGSDGTIYDGEYVIGVKSYKVTVLANQGGSVSPSGTVTVNYGVSQTFTVTPNAGYKVKDVKVDGASVGAVSTYTFNSVSSNHTIEAQFEAITFTITASASSGGTVNPSDTVTVNYGDSKTFTITPNSGYKISNVKVDGVSVGSVSTYTFQNVTADHTIEATFAINTYNITALAGSNGSISPSGNVTVNYGDSKTFTITPNSGYHIADVKVDGTSVGAVSTYAFSNITDNHRIEATFEKNQIVIVLQVGQAIFTVNGAASILDSPPIIKNGRTLLPIRPVVEALGGTVGWEPSLKVVSITLGTHKLNLQIGSSKAIVDGKSVQIDPDNSKVVPEIISSRTMLPLRFVTENLGCELQWDPNTQMITITYPKP